MGESLATNGSLSRPAWTPRAKSTSWCATSAVVAGRAGRFAGAGIPDQNRHAHQTVPEGGIVVDVHSHTKSDAGASE
jgi:hypothetical protein